MIYLRGRWKPISACSQTCSLAPLTCSLAPSISRKYSRKLLKHLVTSGKLTIGYSQAFLKALCFSDQEMLRFLNLLCNYKITKSQTIYFLVSIYTVPGRRKIPKNKASITQSLNRSQMTRGPGPGPSKLQYPPVDLESVWSYNGLAVRRRKIGFRAIQKEMYVF